MAWILGSNSASYTCIRTISHPKSYVLLLLIQRTQCSFSLGCGILRSKKNEYDSLLCTFNFPSSAGHEVLACGIWKQEDQKISCPLLPSLGYMRLSGVLSLPTSSNQTELAGSFSCCFLGSSCPIPPLPSLPLHHTAHLSVFECQ